MATVWLKPPVFSYVTDRTKGYHTPVRARSAAVLTARAAVPESRHAHEARQLRLEAAFADRIEFDTPWGLGIAMQSDDGGSARLAFGQGAVLYVYRDGQGRTGIAARSRSHVDLSAAFRDLRRLDPDA